MKRILCLIVVLSTITITAQKEQKNLYLKTEDKTLRILSANPKAEIGSSTGEITFWYTGIGHNKLITGDIASKGYLSGKALSLNGYNKTTSVFNFSNKIEFSGTKTAAIVFNSGKKDELMFGFHTNGNFYWGTGRSATKPDYYSMFLNGSTGNLGIKGKLTANEVKVKVNGWSDFVFKKNYNLPTLQEVENHIKEKGHLANIPSAIEVKKAGIELGEMDKKLLQKIEELTLYTIKQEKEIQKSKEANKKLISTINKLIERVKKLEKSK